MQQSRGGPKGSLFLFKVIKGAIRLREIVVTCRGVHEVKVREHGVESWFICKGIAGSIMGDLFEHFDNVKEEEGAGAICASLDGFGDEIVKLGGCKMGHEVDATANGNTKLFLEENDCIVAMVEAMMWHQ